MSVRLPSFKPRDLIALLKRAGFEQVYQDSSHLYLRHPRTSRATCVPIHSGDVKRNLARKILLNDCALTISEVQKLL
ncbi:MAG TPA: type II toxin-antitoxin system HicA family toxin [Tepidisphaeraceae bacterium]|nr:type II toxin-antitoxin system HicA family toxin [Tepidisphaeraceae bacterium]